MTEEFITMARFKRENEEDIEVFAHSERDPWEDFKIIQAGYQKHYQLKPGDVVIDGGAYIGMFSCYAAKCVGFLGSVYTFEPIPAHTECIAKNFALNKFDNHNIKIIEKALWSETRKIIIEDRGPESTVINFSNSNKPQLTVDTTTIDEFVSQRKLNRLDFIKLDIEGAELQALIGAEQSLKKFKPKLAIASYHKESGVPTYIEVSSFLVDFGYTVITEFSKHLTTYAWM